MNKPHYLYIHLFFICFFMVISSKSFSNPTETIIDLGAPTLDARETPDNNFGTPGSREVIIDTGILVPGSAGTAGRGTTGISSGTFGSIPTPVQTQIKNSQSYIDQKDFNSLEPSTPLIYVDPSNHVFQPISPSLPGNNNALPEPIVYGPELSRGFYPQPSEESNKLPLISEKIYIPDYKGKERSGKGTTTDDAFNEKQQKEWDLQAQVTEEKRVKNRDLVMTHLNLTSNNPKSGLFEQAGVAFATVHLVINEIYHNPSDFISTFLGGAVTGIPKNATGLTLLTIDNVTVIDLPGGKRISLTDIMSFVAKQSNLSDDIVRDIEIGGQSLTNIMKDGLTDISNGAYNPNKNNFTKGSDGGGEVAGIPSVSGILTIAGKSVKVFKKVDTGGYVNNIKNISSTNLLNPSNIRFSQNTVSYNKIDRITGKKFTYDDLVNSMKKDGWKGDPVDVVKMPDGKLTSMDNTRILAAREAGVEVQATVRQASEKLNPVEIERFADLEKGFYPKTWGEAISGRINNQKPKIFLKENPSGSIRAPKITGEFE